MVNEERNFKPDHNDIKIGKGTSIFNGTPHYTINILKYFISYRQLAMKYHKKYITNILLSTVKKYA